MVAAAILPTLRSSGYYTEPSIDELAAREESDPGYCSGVPNFVVGRVGFGCIKFDGVTDVRGIDLDETVRFDRHLVTVYPNDDCKPPTGSGLNKAAEVTLILQPDLLHRESTECSNVLNRLRCCTVSQGAQFTSFDSSNGEWKFLIRHFSRFGLVEEDEDVEMDDTMGAAPLADEVVEPLMSSSEHELSHSLPTHLGLDPIKVKEMRRMIFSNEDDEDMDGDFSPELQQHSRKSMRAEESISSPSGDLVLRSTLNDSLPRSGKNISFVSRKEPLALLEYNVDSSEPSPSKGIFLTGQNKGLPVRMSKVGGFRLDNKHLSPVAGKKYSSCVVDAALSLGRSFRVGWGPNGMLVHAGSPVGDTEYGLSSIVHIEKVAADKVVRDDKNKIVDDLVDSCFSSPLSLHRSLEHEGLEIEAGQFKLKIQRAVASRNVLPEICRAYIDVIERKLEVRNMSVSSRMLLNHQVTIWELIRVLFSESDFESQLKEPPYNGDEDMIVDKTDGSADIDLEALPLIRRAEFSRWLQDSVCHRVQDDLSALNDGNYLKYILFLLTGRQLESATEHACSRGDVRLAILLSQAGGSMVNRSYMAQQLNLWRVNGLDFDLIEHDRLKIFELLGGNIQGALQDSSVDWKRHLGLIMWYHLSPDTSLNILINTYHRLLNEQKVPYPFPVYIDETLADTEMERKPGDRFDIAYYLMLLHAKEGEPFRLLKTMFSAFSSSSDPLDYHMIWHQRSILEAIGIFSSNDLHLLDMGLIHQLLCLGQCHWAVYVTLHMPLVEDAPFIHEKLIREILSQYCDSWREDELQKQFMSELGIPAAWMHESLALYHEYYGDKQSALQHYIESGNWQKAHTIFMTSIAPYLFLSSNHSEIWSITSTMVEHKSEIADWDFGAEIFLDFYSVKNILQENSADDNEPLQKKDEISRSFFDRLNDSLVIWGGKLPIETRAAFSKMVEELSALLMATPGEGSAPSTHMNCFETMLSGPIPVDHRASRLQEAVSVFTYLLKESQ